MNEGNVPVERAVCHSLLRQSGGSRGAAVPGSGYSLLGRGGRSGRKKFSLLAEKEVDIPRIPVHSLQYTTGGFSCMYRTKRTVLDMT